MAQNTSKNRRFIAVLRRFSLHLCCILILSACKFEPSVRTEKENEELIQVLFVGNSQTYENCGVDCHLKRLVQSAKIGDNVIIESTTAGKFHLLTHLEDSASREALTHEKWDKVILQEYTRGPIHTPDEFAASGKMWKERLVEINPDVEVVFFSTWGYKKKLEMAKQLEDKYREVAEDIDGTFVPVGLFWESLRGKVNLYDVDGAHPNRTGTFASACLFYEYLFDEDVRETAHLDRLIDVQLQIKLKKWAHEYHEKHR